MRLIDRSWHMYPLGLMFGLGFDTATEVALLGISATQAAQGLSPFALLLFPALFTAAMTLVDTADGVLMVAAYGWAFVNPLRKLWYNITLTAASVLVAVFIGGIEGLGLLVEKFNLTGPFWNTVTTLNDDFQLFGCLIVGMFVASWIASLLLYRWKRYDELRPSH
jgi:high-affinity nickel-transport protein